MNSIDKSVEFLLSKFFVEGYDWYEADVFLEYTPFKHFINETTSRKELLEILELKVIRILGAGLVKRRGKFHLLSFRLRCQVDINEGRCVGPWLSMTLIDRNDIRGFPSGSKIAITGRSLAAQLLAGQEPVKYCHRGILLRVNEDEYLVEVRKMDGELRTVLTSWDAIPEFVEGASTIVDNRYLRRWNIELTEVLFRLSRIYCVPLQYDARRMNCDVVATYLSSGHVRETSNTCYCAYRHEIHSSNIQATKLVCETLQLFEDSSPSTSLRPLREDMN